MLNELRPAFRQLRRRPMFSVATVSILALGIGATTAMFSVFDGILLKPLPFRDADRVVAVELRQTDGQFGLSGGAAAAVGALPLVEHLTTVVGSTRTFLTSGGPELVRGAGVSASFFPVFGVPALLGTTFGDVNTTDLPQVVISESLWSGLFARDPLIAGRIVRLDEKPHVVAGVMPKSFAVPEDAEYWVSYSVDASEVGRIGTGPFQVFARLATDDLSAVSAHAAVLAAQITSAGGARPRFVFIPVHEAIGRPHRAMLELLIGAVALVLLIGCANVANLLLAQGRARQQELAVRTAMGATRGRLIRQLLLEAALLAGASAIAGLMAAWVLLQVLVTGAALQLPRADAIGVDLRAVVFTLLLTAATLCFFAVIPAWLSARRPPSLHGSRHSTGRDARRAMRGLVAAEVAITLTLAIASGLTMVSLFRVLHLDLGFDPRDVEIATIRPSPQRYEGTERARFIERVLERVRDTPGIQAAAAISHVPLDNRLAPRVPLRASSAAANRQVDARTRLFSSDVSSVLRIPIVRGRDFTAKDDAGAPRVALINARLADRLWPNVEALGQSLVIGTASQQVEYMVIGIIGDVRGNIVRPPDPEVYLSQLQHAPLEMSIVVRRAIAAPAALARVRAAVAAEDPDLAVSRPRSMREVAAAATAYRRFNTTILGLFAAAALLLSASGVVAVIMSAVAARTREFGIRIALGASRRRMLALVVGDVAPAIAVGVAAGLAGIYNLAFLLTRRALLFDVREFDASTYAAASIAVIGATLISAWLPARRAADQDPAAVLLRE